MAIKIFVFGFPKSGKTTHMLKNIAEHQFQCSYIDLEGGTKFLQKNYKDCKNLTFLQSSKEIKEKTQMIVLDSITKAQTLCDSVVAKNNDVQDISEIPYGKGTKLSSSMLVESLAKLDIAADIFIVVGHCSIQVLQKEKGAVSVKSIKLHTPTLDYVATEFDCIAYFENETVHFSKDKGTKIAGCRFLSETNVKINDFFKKVKELI